MELCDFDMADRAKLLLEEAQRFRRRQFETSKTRWTPAWFELRDDPTSPGKRVHQYKVSQVIRVRGLMCAGDSHAFAK